ncbi:hypothetical protein BU14_1545s0002 [Porphyra umbilicalis]|uniref:Uncharacterized protein n=1 Tax=Porphyra umbilicalis TaxID=2786 RepID=A0A1X6NL88_PORUM|nr:hypothetical protein BU14_1545s0002 [Porphyra umbilicalis]|eukprot:OSX69409.1 hypothetical protein BU14_1545s0002 [Porphyra umbilicalis]
MVNPPIRLIGGPPRNALLSDRDAMDFRSNMDTAVVVVNSMIGRYPLVFSIGALRVIRQTQDGLLVVPHLTAVAYSFWEVGPTGPGVGALTACHLVPPFDAVCRAESGAWGTTRLNAKPGEQMTVLKDTDRGSVVADAAGTTFYLVVGLRVSPATALTRAGFTLPFQTRLTALPFRGVLVYDGLVSGRPVPVRGAQAARLEAAYEAALAAGTVITGLIPSASAPPPPPPVRTDDLHAMSVPQLKAHLTAMGVSASHSFDKVTLVTMVAAERLTAAARRADTGEGSANAEGSMRQPVDEADLSPSEAAAVARLRLFPRRNKTAVIFKQVALHSGDDVAHPAAPHTVAVFFGGAAPLFSFSGAAPVPTTAELLEHLLDAVNRCRFVPELVSVDNRAAAAAVERVTRHAGVQTTYYPPPSVEERMLTANTTTAEMDLLATRCGAML